MKTTPRKPDALSRDGHPVQIVRSYYEDGVEFAVVRYLDEHMPYPNVNGRVAGSEDDPLWEHRVEDGRVLKSGGDYYNDDDWTIERGLQPLYVEIERSEMPRDSFRYGQLASFSGRDSVDAPHDAWLVATPCAHFEDDSTTEWRDVLVVHFIYRDENEARRVASQISERGVTLVRPSVKS